MQNKVSVYWNLHKKCWSVKRARKPVEHAVSLVLAGCTFRVWESGRQRVLREKKKHVHAFACGTPVGPAGPGLAPYLVPVSYNPYKAGHFYRKDTGERVDAASLLILTAGGAVFARLDGDNSQDSDAA